jgi:hypothetical protein
MKRKFTCVKIRFIIKKIFFKNTHANNFANNMQRINAVVKKNICDISKTF